MAIGSVCVDRARIVSRGSTGKRVEGTTRFAVVYGEWFKCRLFLTGAPEENSIGTGNRRTVSAPQLLYVIKDLQGGAVLLNADENVEVNSRQLGHYVWNVTEDPQPIRKRRTVIGYLANLVRVEEHEVDLGR